MSNAIDACVAITLFGILSTMLLLHEIKCSTWFIKQIPYPLFLGTFPPFPFQQLLFIRWFPSLMLLNHVNYNTIDSIFNECSNQIERSICGSSVSQLNICCKLKFLKSQLGRKAWKHYKRSFRNSTISSISIFILYLFLIRAIWYVWIVCAWKLTLNID